MATKPSLDLDNMSMADQLALLSDGERQRILSEFSDEEYEALEQDWSFWSRPSQRAPRGNFFGWLIVTGRGWGKNRTAGEYAMGLIRDGLSGRSAFVARTSADVRDVLVEGESGLLYIAPKEMRPVWEPSRRRLSWPNGAITTTYSAEEPDVLRGPQHDFLWADELAAWKYKETWTNALLGLRIGVRPHWVATTTPKRVPILKELIAGAIPRKAWDSMPAAKRDDCVVLTGGTTYENQANLAPGFMHSVVKAYAGSRLAAQELYGSMLEDSKDALWNRDLLDRCRKTSGIPQMRRIVVSVDPQGSTADDSAETGIVVVGAGHDGHGYLLEDCSLFGKPEKWADAAVAAYHRWKANLIVAEANNGGDMVISTVLARDGTVAAKKVFASRGKDIRAEPVVVLYEQGLVHHTGYYAELEDQQCIWVPKSGDKSPDRLDAAVWGFTELMIDLKRLIYGRDFGIS